MKLLLLTYKIRIVQLFTCLTTKSRQSVLGKSIPSIVLLTLSFILISILLSSCKKPFQKQPEYSQQKTIKSIITNNGQVEEKLIVNYNSNGQVSYVGKPDFTNGYTYKYQGSQISNIEHKVGELKYIINLIYSDNYTLSFAEFKIQKADGTITVVPLSCTKMGDLVTIATNSNDLTFLELQIRDGNLVKALTNAFYLKTSINFSYNNQSGRVYANSIPVIPLKNPLYPTAAVRVNELISLVLQSFSSKQLISFQSAQSFATLNYTSNARNVSAIKCKIEEQDQDGNLHKTSETAITYFYTN